MAEFEQWINAELDGHRIEPNSGWLRTPLRSRSRVAHARTNTRRRVRAIAHVFVFA